MTKNSPEYMKEYQRQRRAGIKKPIVKIKKEKAKENDKKGIKGHNKSHKTKNITPGEKKFLRELIIRSTHRRIITQKESEKALNILYQ